MTRSYLEITYRKGKPFAAYFYFPRQPGDRSARVDVIDSVFNVDYTADGRPIGIEILQPASANVAAINAVMSRINLPPVDANELAPLAAA